MTTSDPYGQGVNIAELTDAPNAQTLAENIVDTITPRTVMRFASATARAATITAPVEGMVTWLQDLNVLHVYDGSAWVTVEDPRKQVTTVVKPADESRTTATYAADTDLVLAVTSGATYQLEAYVAYSQYMGASSTSGIKLGWTAPSGSTLLWTSHGTDSSTSLTGHDVTAQPLSANRLLPSNWSTAMSASPVGLLIAGATGNFSLTWSQVSANSTPTLVLAGSWLRLTRIS